MSMAPRTKSVKVQARESYFSVSDYLDIDEKTDYDAERNIRELQLPAKPTLYKSITHKDHEQHKFYKPLSNRSWILSLFLVTIGICILLLELAVHTYPNAKDVPALDPPHLSTDPKTNVHVRQEDDTGSSAVTTASVLETTLKSTPQSTPESTPSTTFVFTPPPVSTTSVPDNTIVTTTSIPDNNKVTTTPTPDGTKTSSIPVSDADSGTVTVGQPAPDKQITNTQPTTALPAAPAPADELTNTTPTTNAPTTKSNMVNPASEVTITSNQGTGAPHVDNEITITNKPQISSAAEITITSKPVIASSAAGELQITITSKPATSSAPADLQITISTGGVTVGDPYNGNQITVTSNQGTGAPHVDNQVTITTKPQISSGAQVTITSNSASNQAGQVASQVASQVTITNAQGSVSTGTIAFSPVAANQLSVTSTNSGVGQPAPGSQVSVTQSSTTAVPVVLAGIASVVSGSLLASGTAIVGTVPPAAAASVVSGSLIVSGSSILGTVKANALSGTSAGVAAIGSITLTNSAGKPTATVAYTGDVVVTGANGQSTTVSYNGNIVLTNSNGVATQTLSDAVLMTDSKGKVTGTLSYADNIILTDSNGTPTKTVLYTGTATATQAAAADSTDTAAVDSKSATAKSPAFTQWSYFLAMYLPNVIGVVLQSSWLVVFVTFKLMEPFYQLASPGGASAESTLIADYLATGLSASIFKTAADGHWVLILAGTVQLSLALAMLFASDTMNVVATAYCKTKYSDHQPCAPKWVINVDHLRIVEVVLVACFSMIIMIIVLNRKRVSGVYSDPSRISTMADILVHKPLIHELRDIPPVASKRGVALELRDNRYMLGTFVDNGREHYGIVKLDTVLTRSETFKKEAWYKIAYRRVGALSDNITDAVNKTAPILPDIFCMVFTTALFALVLAYFLIKSPTGQNAFNDWMNSNETGPGLLLTVLGIFIAFLVKRKERYFRLSHSYVLLGMGPTPAQKAVTSSTHTTPFDSLYKSATSGHISLTLLSLAAILTDVILILVPTIPFRPSQTSIVYLSSTYIVLIISAIIFLVTVHVTYKEYNHGHRYSDCPETLASVLMRLCASRFVDEKNVLDSGPWRFGADKTRDHDELQRVRYGGEDGRRRYLFGCLEGQDGVRRWMVEEDVHAESGVGEGAGMLRG